MATSVKISNLPPGNFIQSQDEFPVSRSGETYRIAASQIVTEGENIATAPGQGFIYGGIRAVGSRRLLYRPLSGIDGISVNTIGDTVVISASGQNPVMSNFTGNGSTVTFALNEPRSINPNNYRVDIDGVLQKPQEDYNIVGTNLVFTPQSIPPQNTKITVVSNNLVNVYDMIPSDGTVTTNKIFNNAVSTAKIADSAITTPKLSAQAVTNAKLAFDGGAFGFRNKIINGDMRIDQRNNGVVRTNITTFTYGVDRFLVGCINAGQVMSVQQRSGDGPAGFNNYMRVTITTGNAFTGLEQSSIQHRIEGHNAIDLRWGTAAAKTITISFWVRTSIAPGVYTFTINTRSPYTRNYTTTYTVNAANTWEFKTITIPGDTTISNNWIGDNDAYMNVVWNLGIGPDWFGANGSFNNWAGVNLFNSSLLNNTVLLGATTGATIDITGVQLEEGLFATPFEHRPIGTELALCQRYFEYVNYVVVKHTNAASYGGSNPQVIPFQVEKNKIPHTFTTYSGYNLAGTLNAVTRVLANGTTTIASNVPTPLVLGVPQFTKSVIIHSETNAVDVGGFITGSISYDSEL